MKFFISFIISSFVIFTQLEGVYGKPLYSMRGLDTQNASYSHAFRIDEEGQAFGLVNFDTRSESHNHHFFVWSQQEGLQIHYRPRQLGLRDIWGEFNGRGQVCFARYRQGWIYNGFQVYLWDPFNGVTKLTDWLTSFDNEITIGPMNDHGQLLIRRKPARTGEWFNALWDGTKVIPIPKKIMSQAHIIDNHSNIIGTRREQNRNGFKMIGVIYNIDDETIKEFEWHIPFIPQFRREDGTIVGILPHENNEPPDSFIWTEQNGFQIIPRFEITAINNVGVAVGSYTPPGGTRWEPALYKNGEIALLNKALHIDGRVWKALHRVHDINDKGQIAGVGVTKDNTFHAVILDKLGE